MRRETLTGFLTGRIVHPEKKSEENHVSSSYCHLQEAPHCSDTGHREFCETDGHLKKAPACWTEGKSPWGGAVPLPPKGKRPESSKERGARNTSQAYSQGIHQEDETAIKTRKALPAIKSSNLYPSNLTHSPQTTLTHSAQHIAHSTADPSIAFATFNMGTWQDEV